jgi:UDP-N-acetylmuramoylalanine--D-glutamate ligase
MHELTGKHIAIVGAGRSGRAAARLALREGARVSMWDANGITEAPEGVETHPYTNEQDAAQARADIAVLSPGIDTYGPYAQAFASSCGDLIGEVELASRFYQGRIIGITGTNGKTTTTELAGRMLAEAGMGGTPCGNYGPPLTEVVLTCPAPAAIALELSSFQLETIRTLKPDVAVWLNFAPDHMDRYPSLEAYRAAKLRVFENLTADDIIVARAGSDLPPQPAKLVEFSTETSECEWFSDGRLIYQNGVEFLNLESGSGLRGLHNAENAMAAIAACLALGVSKDSITRALHGYSPPPHRCELVRTLDGVEYLNDSKATNLHALESALRSQVRPVVLMAGGKDKGLDYSAMVPLLKEKAVAVVTYGEIAAPLATLCSAAVPSQAVETIEQALLTARSLAPRGSSVLLSPGTSSFDQFNDYTQRGDVFRELVLQLT